MGYNNRDSLRVIFDLETVPLVDVTAYLDQPRPNKNLKDPEKIKANVEEKWMDALDGCGLDPDLCQIVAIGWMREDEPLPSVMTAELHTEAEMLKAFWKDAADRTLVGHNILGFDLPVLQRRSLYLGVPAPMLNMDRYRTNHIDTQFRLSFNGTKTLRGLGWYCRRFKLDVPQDDTTGADIKALVAAGEWGKVQRHCETDVIKSAALARACGYIIQPQVESVL